VLGDVLRHYLFEELIGLFIGFIIIELSTMRLNNVSFVGRGAVGQRVVLIASKGVFEMSLVLPACIFHIPESHGW
jgi:hypothetical protein